MKKLSLNRKHKKPHDDEPPHQRKISSFFEKFKTPETPKENDAEYVANTPEAHETKKRKLSKLRKQSSKLFFGTSSTTSLISGNLEKKPTKIHSPPKKRQLTPDEK